MQKAGNAVPGADVCYTSNIPIGTGLGSIEAVAAGFSLLWDHFTRRGHDARELVNFCLDAEQGYVGKSSRITNPSITLSGLSSHALYTDTQNHLNELIPIVANVSFVIVASRIPTGLPDEILQERRIANKQAIHVLRQFKPDLYNLRDIPSTEIMAYLPYLPEEIRAYTEYIVKENSRVASARSALKRNDMEALGALLYASHNSLRDSLQIISSEPDRIVYMTRQIQGCYGARLVGEGTVSSVVALVASPHVEEFSHRLTVDYRNTTGKELSIFPVVVCNGAWIEIL